MNRSNDRGSREMHRDPRPACDGIWQVPGERIATARYRQGSALPAHCQPLLQRTYVDVQGTPMPAASKAATPNHPSARFQS